MTQHDVIELFKNRSLSLGPVADSQAGIIFQLAQVLAEIGDSISREHLDALVNIGATMYQEGQGLFDARSEVSETMAQSILERKQDQ